MSQAPPRPFKRRRVDNLSAKPKTYCKTEDLAQIGFFGLCQAATRPARMVSDRLTPPTMCKTELPIAPEATAFHHSK
jgi:hypothetical protein